MAQIRFNVKPISDTKMQIRAIFQDGKLQKSKYTGETIPANKVKEKYKYWDQDNELVRGLDSSSRINNLINKWRSAFSQYRDDCKRDNKPIDIVYFIQSLTGTPGSTESVSVKNAPAEATPPLIPIIKKFLLSIKSTHDAQTRRAYKVLQTQIEKYQAHIGHTIYIKDIDRTWHKHFAQYLIEEELNHNAVINRKQGRLITILSYAIEDLRLQPNPDYKKRYNLKETQAPKFPLTSQELATLRTYTTTNPYHRMVLDAFLLACETGLRHSDIIQLKPMHIQTHITPTGIIKYIALTNIKTDKKNNMPLSDQAAAIITTYFETPPAIGFRFHHSQAAGKVLKIIFQDAKIDRPCEVIRTQGARTIRTQVPLHDIISFHMARNTYITRLLSSGVPAVMVQTNAGHANLNTTMSYFRTDDINRWTETLKHLKN